MRSRSGQGWVLFWLISPGGGATGYVWEGHCTSIKKIKHILPSIGYRHVVHTYSDSTRGAVPTFNSCTKCLGIPGIIHDRTPGCHQFPERGCVDDLANEWSFCLQATWPIDVLAYSFDMLPMGVCTTRHRQMSGRLVQELNVCIVTTVYVCVI